VVTVDDVRSFASTLPRAYEVVVRGRVEGSINARKVHLCRSCHVKGEVVHARLEVENGAYFEGDCGPSDDPLAEGSLAQAVA